MSVYSHELLAPGVYAISQGHVRMFLIEGSKRALLLDTGNPGAELNLYVSQLTDKPVTVVLTHAHGDHLGGVEKFPFAYLHPADFSLLAADTKGKYLPLTLDQGFDLGDRFLEVIEIPGHTPGHIALLDKENKMLFSGDTVQTGPIYMFMPHCSFDSFIQSIEKLEARQADFEKIYACHNEMPLGVDILPILKEGAQLMLEGKLDGKKQEPSPGRIMWVYRHKTIAFYGPPVL
ncbi:MAG: MBL fold metallo-hydrolase [Firmicutes bacterium]|jgi:glyoxylase-like metal-dependent hydrolase (beta-lactamase superfamily II)|nr:MBL fold metallo-hydrolase [Bacillota bacterium]